MTAFAKKIFGNLFRCLLTGAACLGIAASAGAVGIVCTTTAMHGNKWICKESPEVCTFTFYGKQGGATLTRKGKAEEPKIRVVVDKWEEKVIIAHEDRPKINDLFVEQYFYKIEIDTGNFLMANEFMTNSGRYLTKEDLAATEKLRFSYYKPSLYSETGKCKIKGLN